MKVDKDRRPDPIDIHVASRVRLRRDAIGMTQEKLAEKMGLSFQQIQKYEKGTNRIVASRLYDLSRILDVPIQFFYEDGESFGTVPTTSVDSSLTDFLKTPEGQKLNTAFAKIKDPRIRKRLVEFVRAVTKDPKA